MDQTAKAKSEAIALKIGEHDLDQTQQSKAKAELTREAAVLLEVVE